MWKGRNHAHRSVRHIIQDHAKPDHSAGKQAIPQSSNRANELRVKKWATAQPQISSQLQSEYPTKLAAWNAQQQRLTQAAAVAEALHRAGQDMVADANNEEEEESEQESQASDAEEE
jgi:hypothetical protein